MLEVSKLIPTHPDIRDRKIISKMRKFVEFGGIFDMESLKWWKDHHSDIKSESLIAISRFPDGKLFIHDGHHRTLAIYLAGRKSLFESEYKITDWQYKDYLEINFGNNWLTPFDPIKEVRLPEFYSFKKRVWGIHNDQSVDHARHLILTRPEEYKCPRKVFTISDLAN